MTEDPVAKIAEERFKVAYLYPIQRFVISNILDGRDQIVILPTGSGKSLCFWLPVELLPGVTLVITPLLALMKDQLRRLSELGVQAGCLMGGQSERQRRTLLEKAKEGELKIIYTTPETLTRMTANGFLASLRVSHLVVDEAHCVSEWGRSFRPSYARIGEFIGHNECDVVSAFTATASEQTITDIRESLFGQRPVSLTVQNPDRPNINYSVLPVLSKGFHLVRILERHAGCCVVFCMSREAAEVHARLLRRRLANRQTRFYHAGLSKEERQIIESWFMASSDGILLATSAYGLGVDKPDIRTIIHIDIPPSVEAFLQESGRAGRDGKPAESILLCSERDVMGLREHPGDLWRQRNDMMIRYAVNRDICRRSFLLTLMGQKPPACSGCDVCQGNSVSEPYGQRIITDFVAKYRRRYSKREVLLLLGGRFYQDTVTKLLYRNPDFGLLKDWDEEDIGEAVDALLSLGRIRVLARGFWKAKTV